MQSVDQDTLQLWYDGDTVHFSTYHFDLRHSSCFQHFLPNAFGSASDDKHPDMAMCFGLLQEIDDVRMHHGSSGYIVDDSVELGLIYCLIQIHRLAECAVRVSLLENGFKRIALVVDVPELLARVTRNQCFVAVQEKHCTELGRTLTFIKASSLASRVIWLRHSSVC